MPLNFIPKAILPMLRQFRLERGGCGVEAETGIRQDRYSQSDHSADIGRNEITIQSGNTKTLRTRTVPIVPALRPWLKHVPLAITFEGLKTSFRRARESAELPSVRFHDLRHSCASILINMNVPLEVVRDVLGHRTAKTTERYAHLQTSKQREALEKLGRFTQGFTQGGRARAKMRA